MRKLKKTVFIFLTTITIIVVVVILFISPIAKYLVERYDEKYTGREITMDWAYVNPFTGYVHFSNVKIYELKSDHVFFTADGISANFSMLKMLSETYEISELTLDHPRGLIIQTKKELNFNDLIEKFSPKKDSEKIRKPVHFSILSIKVNDGEFYYHETLTPINYFIKKVNLVSTGKQWDEDTIGVKFSFLSGIGKGDLKGNFTINVEDKSYRMAAVATKFDLQLIGQYLKDLTNYGNFRANIDADVKATGNFKDEENLTASGLISINDFHFGKNPKDDYSSFDKLVFAINELSPKNHKYLFDSISLSRPYFKYERYDHLDNIQTIFGKKGAKIAFVNADPAKFNLVIEIAKYIKILSKNFFRSDYKVGRLAIYKGDLKYNDYSLSEKFAVDLNPLYVFADSIDKNHKRVAISLRSGIKPYGNALINLSINPNDSSDFDLQYHLQKLPASMFNPYIISYTSFPLDRGTIELNGKWNVRNSMIQSDNHLLIIDPRTAKRLKNKDTRWLPVRLIMAFVRERGNVIDYEIPITGNLKNPRFHLNDVLLDLVENIFVKPATIAYRIEVRNTETEIEKSLTLKWNMRSAAFSSDQEKFIKRMADFLTNNPEVSIKVSPERYATKEKEYILFFEAKKKYYLVINNLNTQSFTEDDSEAVNNMSVKDSLFVRYLDKKTNDSLLFSIQDKCSRFIDSAIVNAKFKQLNKERAAAFMFYFKDKEVSKQVQITNGENTIPYNGFSFYKIEYKGEFPESLMDAYRRMNELNDETPRDKFKKERKKDKNTL